MNILVDTHIALWAITDTSRLSEKSKELLTSKENAIYYSIASVWEVAIKHQLHPDSMTISEEEFEKLCKQAGFRKLGIVSEHIYAIKSLLYPDDAPRHKDPFDRLLLAQAIVEKMKFMTADEKIPLYQQDFVIEN